MSEISLKKYASMHIWQKKKKRSMPDITITIKTMGGGVVTDQLKHKGHEFEPCCRLTCIAGRLSSKAVSYNACHFIPLCAFSYQVYLAEINLVRHLGLAGLLTHLFPIIFL